MNRFSSVTLLFFSAFLVGSSVCWSQNQQGNETPQFEEIPTAAPTNQAPSDSNQPAPVPAAPVPAATTHSHSTSVSSSPHFKDYHVRIWQTNGECLWRIAEKVYGDRSKWRLIYEANKDVIQDPNKIYPNQRLKIPPPDWQP